MDFSKFLKDAAPAPAPAAAATRKRKTDPAAAATPLLDVDNPAAAVLSANQRRVLQYVAEGKNVFMTGRAGCGKSRVTAVLAECLKGADTPFEITASTGIAAEPLGGRTLHQLLCLVPGKDLEACIKSASYRSKAAAIKALKVLFIDEVSMLSAETMELALGVLRAVRPKRMGLPVFVLVGDFCQLAPVPSRGPGAPKTSLLLESPVWKSLELHTVLLRDSWRQSSANPKFLRVLDEARFAELSADSIAYLAARQGVTLALPEGVEPTYLTPLRDEVDSMNSSKLAALPGAVTEFVASVFIGSRDATTQEVSRWLPSRDVDLAAETAGTPHAGVAAKLKAVRVSAPRAASVQDIFSIVHDAAAMLTNSNMEPVLRLKVGAQVMFVANLSERIVNGTRGVVRKIEADGNVTVQLLSGASVAVQPVNRTRPFPSLSTATKEACLVYSQLPLKLAWSITVHKAQGMNLDAARADLGPSNFAHGQVYVTLSRMRDVEGLELVKFDPTAVRADPFVVAWYKALDAEDA